VKAIGKDTEFSFTYKIGIMLEGKIVKACVVYTVEGRVSLCSDVRY
jgi:hypothetical protein